MQVIISGKHLEVSELLKTQIEDAFEAMFTKYSTFKVSTIRVMLGFTKPRYSVDIVVNMKHHEFTTSVEEFDLNKAIDQALDHINVQIDKYAGKIKHHSHDSIKDLEEIEEEEI